MKGVRVVSLNHMCLNYLTDNRNLLSTLSAGRQNDAVCSDYDQVLPSDIVDKLLCRLSEKGKLDDEMLLSTFQAKHTTLKHVQIPDASRVTVEGLKILKFHHLKSLNIGHCPDLSLDNILSCLGSETWESIQCLRCTNVWGNLEITCPFLSTDGHIQNIFRRLVNIRDLAFVQMNLSTQSLRIIAESLPNLRHLDISKNHGITDISPLRDVQLETLIMHDMVLLDADTRNTAETIQQLKNLERLDVSVPPAYGSLFIDNSLWPYDYMRVFPIAASTFPYFDVTMLLKCPSSNPKLTSLELSGRSRGITQELLRAFVEAHPSLDFLGLWGTKACGYSMFDVKSKDYKPGIAVSGDASLDQYAKTLRHYPSSSQNIVMSLISSIRQGPARWTMTSDNDKIFKSLLLVLEMVPTHSVWIDGHWDFIHNIFWCLTHLLRNDCVSNIESDTARWIHRTCSVFEKMDEPAFRFLHRYNDIQHLVDEILIIV